MTQERLRELLRERVADETMPDCSSRAWQAARVVRRRHRLGAAAGVVVATVGVSGAIAAVDSTPPAPPPDTSVPDVAVSKPDATYEGAPVWWSPDQLEEQELPTVDSVLPEQIDLDDVQVLPQMERAVAAFARGRVVVLVGPHGESGLVSLQHLKKVTKPNGYSYLPTSTGMLTPDGTLLVFRQPGDTFALFHIATGQWDTVDTFSVVAAAPPAEAPFDLGLAQRYGEDRDRAQSYGMGLPLPVSDPGSQLSTPEFMVVPGAVLAFMWDTSDTNKSRFKNCCPVAGWLDDQTVVYESRKSDAQLVAWRVGTHDFRTVSRITGAYDVASFALGAG